MLITTALGVAAGGFMGLQLGAKVESSNPGAAEQCSSQTAKGLYAASATVKPLPAIVTNLASPEGTWIRLEAALLLDPDQAAQAGALTAQIAEDLVAFLRTVSLAHIQGPSGFQHLREDLNDRVRVRSAGKVRDLVINSMIVE
jgi:flagellar FliL protein